MNKDFEGILTPREEEELKIFNNNADAKSAVKKVLLSALYKNGTLREGITPNPTQNSAFGLVAARPDLTDEQIGRDLRALWYAVELLEASFMKIGEFNIIPPKPSKTGNPAI